MNRYAITYNNPKSCWYDQCYFHSLLELRFALMKENDFLYIREPVIIPYGRHTLSLPKSKWHPVNFYIPDFLLLDKISNHSILAEIKPSGIVHTKMQFEHFKLARQFIRRMKLKWSFELFTEKDISLTEKQEQRLKQIISENPIKKYVRSNETIVPASALKGLTKTRFISMILDGNSFR